jgi:hypothetical protein
MLIHAPTTLMQIFKPRKILANICILFFLSSYNNSMHILMYLRLFTTVACKDNNFLCNNGKCILWIFTCNNINNCGDNSDESDSCDTSFQNSNKFFGQFFGGFFGAAAGVLFLIIGIIIAVILTCVYNKKCLLYKQRRRRDQPPVVIVPVGEQHEENNRDNTSLINWTIGKPTI